MIQLCTQYYSLHAVLPKTFDNEKCLLDVFIDRLKAFGIVDHKILLKKLKRYGANEKAIERAANVFFPKEKIY